MRRLAAALAAGAAFVVLTAQPAAAKMPYFTVELQPAVPAPGSVATVLVRTWGDAAHTVPTELLGLTTIPRLFCAYPPGAKAVRPGACPSGVWIDVHRAAPDTFTGNVVFPSAGTWILVSFPESTGTIVSGYPDRVPVRVGAAATAPIPAVGHRQAQHTAAAVWFGLGLLVLLAVPVLIAERRRRTAGRVSS